MKTILVTGCCGFIGGHLCETLLARGDRVIGIDNMNSYYNVKQKEETLTILDEYPRFSFIKENITAKNLVQLIPAIPEYIVHLAAQAGVRYSLQNPAEVMDSNVVGTVNMLSLAQRYKIKRFIFASSSSVYGNRPKVNNKIDLLHTYDSIDKTISPYALSKKSGEEFCMLYNRLYGITYDILRFFTVYGPRGRPDMAPFLFTEAIVNGQPLTRFGDGTTCRDYTHVKDIVSGILGSIDQERDTCGMYNLGNCNPIELNEFIKTIERVIGKSAKIIEKPMQQGDVERTCADIAGASRNLNYAPKVKLEEGLADFYKWYITFKGKK